MLSLPEMHLQVPPTQLRPSLQAPPVLPQVHLPPMHLSATRLSQALPQAPQLDTSVWRERQDFWEEQQVQLVPLAGHSSLPSSVVPLRQLSSQLLHSSVAPG